MWGLVLKYTVCVTETMAVLSREGRKKTATPRKLYTLKEKHCHICINRSVTPSSNALVIKLYDTNILEMVIHSGSN